MAFAVKYWNGKLLAVPEMFRVIMGGCCRILGRRLNSSMKRSNLGKAGSNVKIGLRTTFQFPGRIALGRNVSIADDVTFSANNADGYCRIGDDVNIDRCCRIDFSGGVEIGSGCTISEKVTIESHSHGYDPRSVPQGMPLVIEENVWIGMGAVVLPQVRRIGSGAVIAAGAVVTREVAVNAIVGGNPAHVIRIQNVE